MDLPSIPSPEETLADLSWFHPEIHRAFEHGVFKARNHFDTENIELDSSAFSTLVRLHARDYLKKKGFDALDVEHVNLCGLSLKLPKYYIVLHQDVEGRRRWTASAGAFRAEARILPATTVPQ